MKVVVTSQGKDMDAPVDLRFGRAPWFIVVDTETGEYEAVSNEQNLNAPQGAGIQAADNVARTGARALVTGNCGPNAFRTLSEAEIKVYMGSSGTVAEAVEAFKRGDLGAADEANVEGHW